jgi:lysozyme family protein
MANFAPAIEFVLQHEDPAHSGKVTVDSGGRTRFGIAQKFHPGLPDKFFTCPAEEALEKAEQILHDEYWAPLRLDEIKSQPVANKLFDMAVNMGIHQAAIYAQRAANGLLQHQALVPPPRPGQKSAALPASSSSVFADRLDEDGKLGEKSLAAINALEPIYYYRVLCDFSRQHYTHVASLNPSQAQNLAGWLKRADA